MPGASASIVTGPKSTSDRATGEHIPENGRSDVAIRGVGLPAADDLAVGLLDALQQSVAAAARPNAQSAEPKTRKPRLRASQAADLARQLAARRRLRPVVPCSQRAYWVEPEVYCQVRCQGWTCHGHLRHAVFRGLLETPR
jgi:hypothetical protein